jgi:hypothetical protein
MEVSTEAALHRVWHVNCPYSRFGGVCRYVKPDESIVIEDMSILWLVECLHCDERCYVGLDKSRRIVTRPGKEEGGK